MPTVRWLRRSVTPVALCAATLLVTASACTPGLRPRPTSVPSAPTFTGARTDPDPRRLVLAYTGGACDTSAVARAEESDRRVAVEVVREIDEDPCSAVAVPRSVSVDLGSPLGSRRLVDGGDGRSVVPFDGRPAVVSLETSGARTTTMTWSLPDGTSAALTAWPGCPDDPATALSELVRLAAEAT